MYELVGVQVAHDAPPDELRQLVCWYAGSRLFHRQVLTPKDRALGQILLADYGSHTSSRLLDTIRPCVTKAIKRAQADGTLRPELKFNDFSPLLIMTTATAEFVDAGNPRSRSRYLEIVLDGLRARPEQRRLPGRALTDEEVEAATRTVSERRR